MSKSLKDLEIIKKREEMVNAKLGDIELWNKDKLKTMGLIK